MSTQNKLITRQSQLFSSFTWNTLTKPNLSINEERKNKIENLPKEIIYQTNDEDIQIDLYSTYGKYFYLLRMNTFQILFTNRIGISSVNEYGFISAWVILSVNRFN